MDGHINLQSHLFVNVRVTSEMSQTSLQTPADDIRFAHDWGMGISNAASRPFVSLSFPCHSSTAVHFSSALTYNRILIGGQASVASADIEYCLLIIRHAQWSVGTLAPTRLSICNRLSKLTGNETVGQSYLKRSRIKAT